MYRPDSAEALAPFPGLVRIRKTLRHCMSAKGLEPEHLLPGSFAPCWLAMSGPVPDLRRAREE